MPDRLTTRDVWRIASEKGQAADALWQAGLRITALQQAIDALVWADRYQTLLGQSPQEEVSSPDLAAAPSLRELIELRRSQQRKRFAALRKLQKARLRPRPPQSAEQKRVHRVALVASILAAAVLAGWWYVRRSNEPTIDASDAYSKQYPPEAIIDGRTSKRHTEWLLPNKTLGWIELKQPETKHLAALRVRNAFHPPHNSYGTKALRIEVFDGDKLVLREDASFSEHNSAHAWLEIAVGHSADRVRLHALSYYGQGAGFSEVEWVSER